MRLVVSKLSVISAFFIAGVAQAAPYNGAATKGNLSVWRINEHTAAVSLCSYENSEQAPSCYPWSKNAVPGKYKLLASDDLLSVWRLDRDSGRVSICEYYDVSKPPSCTPWGAI